MRSSKIDIDLRTLCAVSYSIDHMNQTNLTLESMVGPSLYPTFCLNFFIKSGSSLAT